MSNDFEALSEQLKKPSLHQEAQYLRRKLEDRGERITVPVSTGQEATIGTTNEQSMTPAFNIGLRPPGLDTYEDVMSIRVMPAHGEREESTLVVGTKIYGKINNSQGLSERDEAICAETIEKATAEFKARDGANNQKPIDSRLSRLLGKLRRTRET